MWVKADAHGRGVTAHLDDRRHVPCNGCLDLFADGLDCGGFAEVVGPPDPHFIDAQRGLDVEVAFPNRDSQWHP